MAEPIIDLLDSPPRVKFGVPGFAMSIDPTSRVVTLVRGEKEEAFPPEARPRFVVRPSGPVHELALVVENTETIIGTTHNGVRLCLWAESANELIRTVFPLESMIALPEQTSLLTTVIQRVEQDRRRFAALWVRCQALELFRVTRDSTANANLAALLNRWDRESFEIQTRLKTELLPAVARLESEVGAGSIQGPLSPVEVLTLRIVLTRLLLLQPTDLVPPPDRILTGPAQKSRVLLLRLPGPGGGRSVIAKFDHPERAEREWRAITALRGLNLPPEFILPYPTNDEYDGVIVYPVAGTQSRPEFVSFGQYLRTTFLTTKDNCKRALDLALESLRAFYAIDPGEERDRRSIRPLTWCELFPKLEPAQSELLARTERIWPGDWSAGVLPGMPALPNPLSSLKSQLYEGGEPRRTGRLHLSWTHGDLNLTNLLVCPAEEQSPHRVYIIDLTYADANQPAVLDLARLEVEFWTDAYAKSAVDRGLTVEAALDEFFTAREVHDRDPARRGSLSAATLRAFEFIQHLYESMFALVGGRWSTNKIDMPRRDYFEALYFQFLSKLRHPEVWEGCGWSARFSLVGAALALRVLIDLKRGCYGSSGEPRCFFRGS